MLSEAQTDDTRALLQGWREGDPAARDRLFERLYPEIEKAAAGMLRFERGVSLSAGDLVQEVMVRLIGLDQLDWQDRSHFLALASRMMRRSLIDHVRRKRSAKRDHVRVDLHSRIEGDPRFDLEDIEFALGKLGEIDPSYAEIVEMRYFGGMSLIDIAAVQGCSESTIKRRWRVARAWLIDWMDG